MKDYNSKMKISQIKSDMRITIMKEIEDYLKSKYEIVGKVSANEIAVVMGTYQDEEGFEYDTSVVLKISAKPFYSKEANVKKNGQLGREIKIYDAATNIENFQLGIEE